MNPALPARKLHVTIQRIVEWPDTDAAGHYHHSAVVAWIEAAEAELYEQLGLLELYGAIPRVRYEVDFRARLWFRDRVTIDLWVAEIGTTSLRHAFVVRRDDDLAASGSLTVVHIDPRQGCATAWPDDVRALLGATGA